MSRIDPVANSLGSRQRASARLLAAVAVIGALASACTSAPLRGAWYANATDLARAQRVWSDPWVAPTATKATHYQASNSGVLDRVVGVRTTESAGGAVRARAKDEVAAAVATGWELVTVACTTSGGAPEPTRVDAVLQRRTTDLDHAATATVTTAAAWSGSATTFTTVSVTVPHHLDTWWPREHPTAVELTCLGTGQSATITPTLRPGPWTDRGPADPASLPSLAVPTWSGPAVPDDLAAAVGAASADPWLTQLRLAPALPQLTAAADDVRSSAAATAPAGRSLGRLADLVTAAPTPWRVTYAACFGSSGPAAAELVREVGSGRWITVRLGARGDDDAVTGAWSVISTPGWSRTPGPVVTDPCFMGSRQGTTFMSDGIPAFGPTSTQPMLAGS
jgi:hypothetical protein